MTQVKYPSSNTTSAAFDLGYELFKREPELIGVAVWWRAVEKVESLQGQFDFVSGYMSGHKQRDDHDHER